MALRLGNINMKKLSIESLYNAYFGMSPREQTAALVGAAIAVVLIVVLPIWVASSRINKLEGDVAQSKRQFRDVVRAIDSYNGRKTELERLQKMLSGGFDASPSTTLEAIADRNGMKDQIDSLKAKPAAPSDIMEESAVDMRLKKVRLEPLVTFLHAIENDPDKLLRVKALNIKPRFDNKQDLDASFTVSTYRLLEGAQEGT